MFLLRKVFALFIFALSFCFLFSQSVRADENFDLSLTSTFTVQNNGVTTVAQKFTLTNKTPTLFAKQYALEFGSTRLRNVRVSDENGTVPANITATDSKTSVGITFNDIIVGEGKNRTFTVQFESDDIALISGNVLEVYISKVSDIDKYTDYQAILRVPSQFGQPARVSPANYAISQEGGATVLNFNNLRGQSISALFGQKQVFDYNLRYHLQNTTGNVGIAQVALPPDTKRQKVEYLTLDPRPREMSTDADGNWIATYEIAAEKDLTVNLTGKVSIFLEDQADIFIPAATNEHLKPQKHWESNNSKIQELASTHQGPRAVYDYVVGQLKYNYEKANGAVERLGALGALDDPENSACQEFTDLFIAVARAQGIPARRATGFAYTENSRLRPLGLVEDVLHSWPEYYDRENQAWIPIDPTWGNTTGGINYFDQFDFNHIVFATNGVSSQLPYPAGTYKKAAESTKDVEISFGKSIGESPLAVTMKVKRQPFWSAPFQNTYFLVVTNEGGRAWYNVPLTLSDPASLGSITYPTKIDYLLPFQTREIPFAVGGSSRWQKQRLTLTASLGSLLSSHELTTGFQTIEVLRSAPLNPVALGTGMVIFALTAGSLLVFRRPRQRPVRRQGQKP